MTRIKICGITGAAYARSALEAGADLIGVVFAPSPRRVTAEEARDIVAAVGGRVPVVGVFVNAPAGEVNEAASFCRLDRVQLSGDEDWEYCQRIERPVIRAIRVPPEWDQARLLTELEEGQRLMGHRSILYLMDTLVTGRYGGTGQTVDWGVARGAAARFPLIIAGGLNPENVGAVVSQLQPWGVDVSSGVETDGVKSVPKIRAFVQAVRSVSA